MVTIDNNIAHREIKTLMRQGKNLDIRIDESFALISTHAVTGLQYMLTPDNWQWLLNYLQTGDYEDFGIFPSLSILKIPDFFPVPINVPIVSNKSEITNVNIVIK